MARNALQQCMHVHILYHWDLLNWPTAVINQLVFGSKPEQSEKGRAG